MNTNHIWRYPAALTVAGSDSSGGAGIQADLKTFSALGVYAASVITAVTAQNTRGVYAVEAVSSTLIRAQWAAVCEDLPIDAVKIGMLYTVDAVRVAEEALDRYAPAFTVLDPVLLSTSGQVLLEKNAVAEMAKGLFPKVSLLTPNRDEAEYLTGIPIRCEADAETAAARLLETGCAAVLIKGGHGPHTGKKENQENNEAEAAYETEVAYETKAAYETGPVYPTYGKREETKEEEKEETVADLLFMPGQPPRRFTARRVITPNSHGTGCTLSSAITAYRALGYSLPAAVEAAKLYMTAALSAGAEVRMGTGHGPVNHFFRPVPLHKIKSPGCILPKAAEGEVRKNIPYENPA